MTACTRTRSQPSACSSAATCFCPSVSSSVERHGRGPTPQRRQDGDRLRRRAAQDDVGHAVRLRPQPRPGGPAGRLVPAAGDSGSSVIAARRGGRPRAGTGSRRATRRRRAARRGPRRGRPRRAAREVLDLGEQGERVGDGERARSRAATSRGKDTSRSACPSRSAPVAGDTCRRQATSPETNSRCSGVAASHSATTACCSATKARERPGPPPSAPRSAAASSRRAGPP